MNERCHRGSGKRAASHDIEAVRKRPRKFYCDCSHISLDNCNVCAKIARKIYRLFGKRLALTEAEMSTIAPCEPPGQDDGMLVFADEPCDCPQLSSEGCATCAAFAIKMGMFVNIYSKKGIGDDVEGSPGRDFKYKGECDCVYVSNIGCNNCLSIAKHIEQIFSKKVYPSVNLAPSPTMSNTTARAALPLTSHLSKYLALDCEMVGVMDYTQKNVRGRPKMVNALARCSIVDALCNVVLDIYVRPDRPIADYRTKYSGVTKSDMTHAISADEARRIIVSIVKDRIVVGHTLDSDFAAIKYVHPASRCRDIVKCNTLRQMYLRKSRLSGPGLQRIGLKKLSAVLLNSVIQQGSHCSVEDAVHTMKLYLLVQNAWEGRIEEGDNSDITPDVHWQLHSKISSEVYLDDSYWSTLTDEH